MKSATQIKAKQKGKGLLVIDWKTLIERNVLTH